MILVLGSAVAHEEHLADALRLSAVHVARSRAERGCLAHAVHQDTENHRHLVFVEQWADQAALMEHFKVPASRAFAKALAGLSSEAPSITVYEAAQVRS
jgi:quinol monooxygenase YgiN